MKKLMLCMVALAATCGTTAKAQDFAGAWQGTIKPSGGGDLRLVVKVSKGDKGGWSAKLYNAGRAMPPMNASSVTVEGSTFKFAAELIGASFEGKLSADGATIVGSWTMGDAKTSVTLARATPETAWDIPEPPAPEKPMAADANPSFDVATIKPNPSGAASLQQLTINGRNFTIRNGSLGDLIAFAYNVQMKQIVDGPSWMDTDRYDIAAVPDVEGEPNVEQLRTMMRKLLTDRFQLKFHHDKRELGAFVLSGGKSSEKLVPSEAKGLLPNIGVGSATNGMKLTLQNATVTDFTGFLQFLVLDRPVVDQTGIAGRYDMTVTFTPDDSQFNGHPPKVPALAEGTEPAPDLYSAIQQQLGMKLSAEKTQVDVLVIDHVEKPSAN
jgi:uncharacterized protein (TIGR03435 family)